MKDKGAYELRLVLIGPTCNAGEQSPRQQILIDIPLDGIGPVIIQSNDAISPVFTLWLTLMLMFIGKLHSAPLRCCMWWHREPYGIHEIHV